MWRNLNPVKSTLQKLCVLSNGWSERKMKMASVFYVRLCRLFFFLLLFSLISKRKQYLGHPKYKRKQCLLVHAHLHQTLISALKAKQFLIGWLFFSYWKSWFVYMSNSICPPDPIFFSTGFNDISRLLFADILFSLNKMVVTSLTLHQFCSCMSCMSGSM